MLNQVLLGFFSGLKGFGVLSLPGPFLPGPHVALIEDSMRRVLMAAQEASGPRVGQPKFAIWVVLVRLTLLRRST